MLKRTVSSDAVPFLANSLFLTQKMETSISINRQTQKSAAAVIDIFALKIYNSVVLHQRSFWNEKEGC